MTESIEQRCKQFHALLCVSYERAESTESRSTLGYLMFEWGNLGLPATTREDRAEYMECLYAEPAKKS